MNESRRRNRITVLLAVTLFQMCIGALLLNNLSMEGWSVTRAEDSDGYLLGVRFFAGEEIQPADLPLLRYRLFSPLVPFLAALLARLIPLEYTFLVLNSLLWLLSACLFYRFSGELLNERQAYHSALLFTTSLPLIVWGLPIMLDTAASFFALINCLLIVQLPPGRKAPCLVITLTLALTLAILAKPNLVSLVAFFALYAGIQKQYTRVLAVSSGIVLLAGGVYYSLGLGMEDLLTYGYLRHRGPVYLANALLFCFHWGLPLAVWGFCREKRQRVFYLTYLASTLGCYLAFVHNPRLLLVTVPAVIPLVVSGLGAFADRVSKQWRFPRDTAAAVLVGAHIVTTNLLTVLYLYLTRVLQYRSIESIRHLLG